VRLDLAAKVVSREEGGAAAFAISFQDDGLTHFGKEGSPFFAFAPHDDCGASVQSGITEIGIRPEVILRGPAVPESSA
jgi:hypothetical protein